MGVKLGHEIVSDTTKMWGELPVCAIERPLGISLHKLSRQNGGEFQYNTAMNNLSGARKLRHGTCSEVSQMEDEYHACQWKRSV